MSEMYVKKSCSLSSFYSEKEISDEKEDRSDSESESGFAEGENPLEADEDKDVHDIERKRSIDGNNVCKKRQKPEIGVRLETKGNA